MKTTLKLSLTDTNNNSYSKNIPCVNPAASNYVLKTFANALNSLTNDTLTQIDRIDETDITNATNE